MPARAVTLALLWSLLHAALPPAAGAQVDAFRFDSARVPVGRLYEYLKSNRDGTHASHVSLYVAALDRIESLKWTPGDTTATLVVALLDWQRFSVRRLESWSLTPGAAPRLRAALDTDSTGTGVRASFQPDSLLPIHRWPWHSYDFDFASLNLTLVHLIAPEAPFSFERADVIYGVAWPPFVDIGPVHVRFVRREQRRGHATRRYALEGTGLLGHHGVLWAAVDGAHVVEFELPFPDEPGYTDVRLQLRGVQSLARDAWEEYKRRRVRGGP